MFVYGKNVAKELINNNIKIKKAYISDTLKNNDIEELLKENNILIEYKTNKQLDFLVDGLHQGYVFEIEDYKYINEEYLFNNLSENPFIVILDHIEDPHNFGAIIRTCEAAGVDYIVIPKNRCVTVNSTVMKTSAGALNNVKIAQITNINNFINKLKKSGVWVVGTALEDSVDYDKVDYTTPTALIIGNEGKGISDLVRKNCDFVVKIPMVGTINSLNASVAAGIMIYEVIKQRK